jgi:hypothetical protein
MISRGEWAIVWERRGEVKGELPIGRTRWLLYRGGLQSWHLDNRGINVGENPGNICLLEIGTDTAEERDTVLRTKLLLTNIRHDGYLEITGILP